jgi:hypothetical protein
VRATKNNNFSSEQTFTISVNDVAPSTPVDSNAGANTVLEGAANGTAVGVTASSTDVNGPGVTWSLIGDTSGGGFTINAATGVITVADGTKIDYESSPGHAYTVTAQASTAPSPVRKPYIRLRSRPSHRCEIVEPLRSCRRRCPEFLKNP